MLAAMKASEVEQRLRKKARPIMAGVARMELSVRPFQKSVVGSIQVVLRREVRMTPIVKYSPTSMKSRSELFIAEFRFRG